MRKLLATLLITLLFTGCDLFEYHPYDCRISGRKNINASNIARIENNLAACDSFCFAVISDTQRWYDETKDAVSAINSHGGIDFVVHCGDLADFGATKEFVWMRDILDGLDMPYVCIIGNHDCLGTGKDAFASIFGENNFAFTAGNVRFVCLNTNSMEYDYSEPVPDFNFIQNEIDSFPSSASKTIIAMHAKPTDDQFNNNVAKIYEKTVLQFPHLLFSLCGHGHQQLAKDLYNDGNVYYECPNVEKREYLVFKVTKDGYTYQAVDF
jgi:3',5'-cyclic AMP phosphodiesterase CpdA